MSESARRGELAATLIRERRLDEARAEYDAAVTAAPNDSAAWLGLGRVKFALGDMRGALSAWERAVGLGAVSWSVRNDLGTAWMELREWDAAEESFAQALSMRPGDPSVLANAAALKARRGHPDRAIAAFQACLATHPSYTAAWAGLGSALRDVNRLNDAAIALERATALAPSNVTYGCALARVYLESGLADRASQCAQSYLQRQPGHSGALAVEALARAALGDAKAVARFFDYRRLILAKRLSPVPAGFPDLSAFNLALAYHAETHPSLMAAPASHATAVGLHSGSLLCEPRGPIAPFERALSAAIAAYGRRADSWSPPLLHMQKPQAVRLEMWCVVLHHGGHQIPHIHPSSWLSGVYYPRLPPTMAAQKTDEAGALEFGLPDRPFPSRFPVPRLRIQPQEGLLVLFPSYLFHQTVPFKGPGTRISVAFDVMPLEGAPT